MPEREALTEFDIIARFFDDQGKVATDVDAGMKAGPDLGVELGVGDDCALLSVAPGQQLALSMDTLVAGRHFPLDARPEDIGYRALAVATSDLAATGAKPYAATLALTLPEADTRWLQAFSAGLHQGLADFSMRLVGGDTTRGPLSITLQVHGTVPSGAALLRHGASVGDSVYVSGWLGDACAALQVFNGQGRFSPSHQAYLRQRFYRPTPRLALGEALRGIASSAIDISDGLVADLGHIAERSGVAAEIVLPDLPLSAALTDCDDREQVLAWAATGGDDYELCFTVSPQREAQLAAIADRCGVSLCRVGSILPGTGVQVVDGNGQPISFAHSGYQHFTTEPKQ